MKINRKLKEEIYEAARKHNHEASMKLKTKEAAEAIKTVISNSTMAEGLIKLLLSFSCLEYIARNKEGLPHPEADVFLDCALEVAFQWKGNQMYEAGKIPRQQP